MSHTPRTYNTPQDPQLLCVTEQVKKRKEHTRVWGHSSVAAHWPHLHEALGSTPSTTEQQSHQREHKDEWKREADGQLGACTVRPEEQTAGLSGPVPRGLSRLCPRG